MGNTIHLVLVPAACFAQSLAEASGRRPGSKKFSTAGEYSNLHKFRLNPEKSCAPQKVCLEKFKILFYTKTQKGFYE